LAVSINSRSLGACHCSTIHVGNLQLPMQRALRIADVSRLRMHLIMRGPVKVDITEAPRTKLPVESVERCCCRVSILIIIHILQNRKPRFLKAQVARVTPSWMNQETLTQRLCFCLQTHL
jgi:hypothetical protein